VLAAPDDFGAWSPAQPGRLPKDFELEICDVQSIIASNDPGRWPRPLAHRPEPDLPFHPLQVPAGLSLLLYATLYIYQLQAPIANVDYQFDGFSNDPSWCIAAC